MGLNCFEIWGKHKKDKKKNKTKMKMDFCLVWFVVLVGSILAIEEEELPCFGNLNMTSTEGQLIAKVKEMINGKEEIAIE